MTNPAQPSALLAQLFAPGIATAELREDADASLLYPAEAACCAGFAPRRMTDFVAGRLCARRALADLGIGNFPIAIQADRSPQWPPGITGSISHTDGYRCAVAAREAAVGSIGVDVEILGRVTCDVAALVLTPHETDFLSTLSSAARMHAATIIFSAKEALYKCQYPIGRQWLDFRDVTVELVAPDLAYPSDVDRAAFAGSFRVAASFAGRGTGRVIPSLQGRFSIDGALVATGITLRRPSTDVDA